MKPPSFRGMKDGRPRPGHPFENHEPQRIARHVDSVTKCVRSEKGGVRIITEDVDERACVDRVNVLRQQRQARTC